MIVKEKVVSIFQQNARIVACSQTKRAICIDPGDEGAYFAHLVDELGLELQAIALTHAHLDHIGGVASLKRLKPAAEILLHKDDEEMYRRLPDAPAFLGIPREQWAMLGLRFEAPPPVDRYWQDGEIYTVGQLRFEVRHCPGHAPGHVILFEERERAAFVGDCLFAGSIGRTDLPGGSMEVLLDSIHRKILPLGDDVRLFTGHGENTRIGHERLTNPFLTIGSGVFKTSLA